MDFAADRMGSELALASPKGLIRRLTGQHGSWTLCATRHGDRNSACTEKRIIVYMQLKIPEHDAGRRSSYLLFMMQAFHVVLDIIPTLLVISIRLMKALHE